MGFDFHIPLEERRAAPWVAGLALFAFFAALLPVPKALLWDEAVYLSTAENLGKTTPYYSEIATRPPLLPVLLRAGGSVMRMETFGHLFGAAIFAAGVVVLYLLGRRLFGVVAGVISAALLAVCPFFLHFSHKIMADVPATVLATAAMVCFFEHAGEEDDEPHGLMAVAAGVFFAAAVLLRFELAALFVVPVYMALANRVGFRPVLITAGTALVVLAPYLVWAQFRMGGFWSPFVAAISGEGQAGIGYYARSVWMIAGPAVLAGVALYLAPLGRRKGDTAGRDIPLLLWFAMVVSCVGMGPGGEPRYLLPAMPVVFLYAGAGYARCTRKQLATAAAVITVAAFGYQVTHLPYFRGSLELGEAQLLSYADRTREAADFLRPQLHPTDVVYTSSLHPLVAWYCKAPTVALWPWTDAFYAEYPKNMKRDGYLVFYRGFGKEPNQEWLDHRLEFRKVKEFPEVIIYAYSIPVPLSKPEAAEGTDGVGAVSPTRTGNR